MEFIDGESNLRAGAGTGLAVKFQPKNGATGIVMEFLTADHFKMISDEVHEIGRMLEKQLNGCNCPIED